MPGPGDGFTFDAFTDDAFITDRVIVGRVEADLCVTHDIEVDLCR